MYAINMLKRQRRLAVVLKRASPGFGLLEAIISALFIAILVSISLSVTDRYQAINYRSSLRQALAQTIEDDLTQVKLELVNYLYQPRNQAQNLAPCYATNRRCQQSNVGVGQCMQLARRAVNASPLIRDGVVNLRDQRHQIFQGLSANSDLRRTVTIQQPDAPSQARQSVRRLDQSIVRVRYELRDELASVLFDSNVPTTIASVDLSPSAHAFCQF